MILIKTRRGKLVFALVTIFLLFSGRAYGEVKNIKGGSTLGVGKRVIDAKKQQEVLEELFFNNYGESVVKLFPERNEKIFILTDILKNEKFSLEKRITAAQVYGALRIDSDLNLLINNFLLGYEKRESFEELNGSNFPVGFALINVGTSSARLNLLNKIKLTHDEEMIRLCAFVLMKIEDKDVAKFILEREIKKETVVSQKENLEKALEALSK